jgi:hypothetical protein
MFSKLKLNKSLVFVELMCDFPHIDVETKPFYSFLYESLLLITMYDPWYGYILLYLQNQCFWLGISRDKSHRIRHHSKYYLIMGDTLYRCCIDTILWWCLNHEEVERVLNEYHLGSCGGHLSWITTTQKILCTWCFWPSIFKHFIEAIKNSYHVKYSRRKHISTLLYFIQQLLLAHFQYRALILCKLILP